MGALIRVTAWEKASPVRRVLCAFGRVAILFALLLALLLVAYANRYTVAAKIWHWKHGYSATMGNYVFPVAEHWLIVNQDSASTLMLNTSPNYSRRDGKFHTTAVITLSLFPRRESSFDQSKMDFWLLLNHDRLEREGVKEIEENTVSFGDESITCIGGSELSAAFPDVPNVRTAVSDIISLDCMSQRGLEIRLGGEPSDLEPFYTFLSQIRRRR